MLLVLKAFPIDNLFLVVSVSLIEFLLGAFSIIINYCNTDVYLIIPAKWLSFSIVSTKDFIKFPLPFDLIEFLN